MRSNLLSRLTFVAVLAALPTASLEARGPYSEGEEIEITGTAIDEDGGAVVGAMIVLRASRVGWSFRAINLEDKGRTVKDTTERSTRTDANGRFTIPWRWHDYYNRFELLAGTASERGGKTMFAQKARIDLTSRIRQGSPVVTSFTLAPSSGSSRVASPPPTPAPPRAQAPARPSSAAERFNEAASSDDERRILREMGQPDRVEVFDGPAAQEVTWWYFRLGKAYRFVDGDLDEVSSFEPVEPF